MKNKYYKELRVMLKKKALSIHYSRNNEFKYKNYYDYYYFLGNNKILSNIIVKLVNNNRISEEELYDMWHYYLLAHSPHSLIKIETPLFICKDLDREKFELFIELFEKDKKIKLNKKTNNDKNNSYLYISNDDIFILQRIHNLISEELVELEYKYDNDLEKKDKLKVENKTDYQYKNGLGKLRINKFELIFMKTPSKIIKYFWTNLNIDDTYKTYKDYGTTITSAEFSKTISDINKRVFKETEGYIKEIIHLKEKNKVTEINQYKFKILT